MLTGVKYFLFLNLLNLKIKLKTFYLFYSNIQITKNIKISKYQIFILFQNEFIHTLTHSA
jgi:hypothetical protein